MLGILAATLAVFGVAAVYGATSIRAVQQGHPGGEYALRQLLGVALGLMALLIVARLDYRRWRPLAWPLLGITAVLLLIPLLPFASAIAPELNGARRWIRIGAFSIQPSELAKFAVVVWTAMLVAKKDELVREFKRGVMPIVAIVLPLTGLIVLEPDLSTGAVVLLLAGTVMFTAGARIGHFLLLTVLAIPIMWHEIVSVQYRFARMVSFLSAGGDAADANWQISQSLIGIGSGRLLGVGFGEGLQKLGYLQYAYSDFIFSTIGEEWGFIGVLVIVGLFGLYVAMGFRIARRAPDSFGLLLTVGLTTMIGLAAVLHIGVTLSVVPTTGISLPFISYGRSGLLVSFVATGLIMSVARCREERAKSR
ncbi:MAG: putative lipid II flippase FtsW [Gemmatimonadota bacterium]|nr:putative lipid II flippase FtsW [Gemmatimonadota bacterium]